MKLIDLSQTVEPGMPLFSAAAPQPAITAWQSHADAAASGRYQGCTCEISRVEFVTSIGTYLDSPYHFHPAAASIERLDLEQLVLPGVVLDCTWAGSRAAIGPDALPAGADLDGKAVLFRTDWSRRWGQPDYPAGPYLTGDAAATLRERGVRLAGADFLVIDDTNDPRRPVHVTLLGADILIVENLANLAALPAGPFTFHAAPAKIAGAAAFPVRAYAVV